MAIAIRVQEPRPPPQVTRLSLEATGTTALNVNGDERDLTITPDGSRVIYVGDGGRQIFVRALDNLEPQSLVKPEPCCEVPSSRPMAGGWALSRILRL